MGAVNGDTVDLSISVAWSNRIRSGGWKNFLFSLIARFSRYGWLDIFSSNNWKDLSFLNSVS